MEEKDNLLSNCDSILFIIVFVFGNNLSKKCLYVSLLFLSSIFVFSKNKIFCSLLKHISIFFSVSCSSSFLYMCKLLLIISEDKKVILDKFDFFKIFVLGKFIRE